MKNIVIIICLLFLSFSKAFGQANDSLIERTGYLLISDNEAIWIPRKLDVQNIASSFLTCQQDTGGLNVGGFTYLEAWKKLGVGVSVNLPAIDSATKEVVYTFPTVIRIIPAKAKLKYQPKKTQSEQDGVFFKRNECMQAALYRNWDFYSVVDVTLIRIEDKKGFRKEKRIINRYIKETSKSRL